MPIDAGLAAAAKAWRDDDPDPETGAELDGLLAAGDEDGLRDRFAGSLQFGTAGLRGELGAGPNRMNRAVVIRATAGLARYLINTGHAGEPVVVGLDARHKSDVFAADTAAVLAAAGFEVHLFDRPVPTPVLAFAVLHLGCCAGVQITASHNPPKDNGYKVYLGDGAQIIPPADKGIAAAIDAVPSVGSVPRDTSQVHSIGDEVVDAYVAAAAALTPTPPSAKTITVVYTPMHGVGCDVTLSAFERAGYPAPHVVAEQAEPDPDFPTVSFPNPEEPGALDLSLALAGQVEADVVIANDPDADRLAVAIDGKALTGDETGILLADYLLAKSDGPDRLVITTIVSSSMLSKLAAARGVHYAETLTGFKWIAHAAMARPDLEFVYGYEEALGSCVGTMVRDKDGITSALAFAGLVAELKAAGRTVRDRLHDLAAELGAHVTKQISIRFEGLDGLDRMRAVVDRLATAPPATLAGRPVTEVDDLRVGSAGLPPTDGVRLRADGLRLIVRPSGTEPKLKCYLEAVAPTRDEAEALLRSAEETVAGIT